MQILTVDRVAGAGADVGSLPVKLEITPPETNDLPTGVFLVFLVVRFILWLVFFYSLNVQFNNIFSF